MIMTVLTCLKPALWHQSFLGPLCLPVQVLGCWSVSQTPAPLPLSWDQPLPHRLRCPPMMPRISWDSSRKRIGGSNFWRLRSSSLLRLARFLFGYSSSECQNTSAYLISHFCRMPQLSWKNTRSWKRRTLLCWGLWPTLPSDLGLFCSRILILQPCNPATKNTRTHSKC